jgi:hypothetical protein
LDTNDAARRTPVPDERTTVVNLTPHHVHLVGERETVELPPAGPPARLVLRRDEPLGQVAVGPVVVPVVRTSASGEVIGLPDRRPGVLLLVGRAVAEALPHRDDLVFPHDTVRNDRGAVVGCRALGHVGDHLDLDPEG